MLGLCHYLVPTVAGSSRYSRAVGILARINRAIKRLNRALGSGEGTAEGNAGGVNPALRHLGAAEREQFPSEELTSDEREENEQ